MCFSLYWFANLLVWLIIICGVVALGRLLIAFLLPHLGLSGDIVNFIVRAFWIVFWVIVCVAAVWFIVDLIACIGPPALYGPRHG